MKISQADGKSITSMHCGGRIMQLLEAEDMDELERLVEKLDAFLVIGGGTNTIFEDTLITTPVIKLGKTFDYISVEGEMVSVGAATPIYSLLMFCRETGLSGVEFMAGIPGTLGGAICMNAGTNEKGFMDAVSSIDVVDKTGRRSLQRQDITYTYRRCDLPPQAVIIRATLMLKPSNKDEVRAKIASFMERRRNQPKGYSSGSIFKNPPGASAGFLIDKAGLKGVHIGGARVSEIHANYIVNDGDATTADVKQLIALIRVAVWKEFGIELEEEVRIVG